MNGGSAIDERVSELVHGHREELVELVRQALDAELGALVDQELDAALGRLAATTNGTAPAQVAGVLAPTGAIPANEAQARELRADCGERPRLQARSVCQRCKNRRDLARRRERREARALAEAAPAGDAEEPPRPGA